MLKSYTFSKLNRIKNAVIKLISTYYLVQITIFQDKKFIKDIFQFDIFTQNFYIPLLKEYIVVGENKCVL